MRIQTVIISLLMSFLVGGAAQAVLIAYEGFDYPISSSIQGQTGGIGFSAWDSGPGAYFRIPSGLSHGGLPTSGGGLSLRT